jgi:hypothetical protein
VARVRRNIFLVAYRKAFREAFSVRGCSTGSVGEVARLNAGMNFYKIQNIESTQ